MQVEAVLSHPQSTFSLPESDEDGTLFTEGKHCLLRDRRAQGLKWRRIRAHAPGDQIGECPPNAHCDDPIFSLCSIGDEGRKFLTRCSRRHRDVDSRSKKYRLHERRRGEWLRCTRDAVRPDLENVTAHHDEFSVEILKRSYPDRVSGRNRLNERESSEIGLSQISVGSNLVEFREELLGRGTRGWCDEGEKYQAHQQQSKMPEPEGSHTSVSHTPTEMNSLVTHPGIART